MLIDQPPLITILYFYYSNSFILIRRAPLFTILYFFPIEQNGHAPPQWPTDGGHWRWRFVLLSSFILSILIQVFVIPFIPMFLIYVIYSQSSCEVPVVPAAVHSLLSPHPAKRLLQCLTPRQFNQPSFIWLNAVIYSPPLLSSFNAPISSPPRNSPFSLQIRPR